MREYYLGARNRCRTQRASRFGGARDGDALRRRNSARYDDKTEIGADRFWLKGGTRRRFTNRERDRLLVANSPRNSRRYAVAETYCRTRSQSRRRAHLRTIPGGRAGR